MSPKPIRRVGHAHRHEAKYSATKQRPQEARIIINAHDFLEYAHLRAQVARFVEEVFHKHPDSALVGFLTGSVGPTVNARMFIEGTLKLAHRVRYASGLAHHDKEQTTEPEFHGVLDDLYARGIRHFIIVDEIVGGGSIRGAMNSLRRWSQQSGHRDCNFHVVGVYEHRRHTKVQSVLMEIRSEFGDMPVRQIEAFPTRVLLEMDKQGVRFRAIKRTAGRVGEYEFQRERAEQIEIRCPAGGASQPISSLSSVDQVFGGMIGFTIGEMKPLHPYVWPLVIRWKGCRICRRLLLRARRVYRPLCPPRR